MSRAAKKRPSSRRQQIDVNVRGIERLRPYMFPLMFIGAAGAALTVLVGWWTNLGLPKIVIDRELREQLDTVKQEVQQNIGATKVEVMRHTEEKAKESKQDIDSVKDKLGLVGKDVRQSMLISLETSTRTLWGQVSQQKTTLGNIEMLLREKPNDTFLIQRKAEVEQLIRTFETQLNNAQAQLDRVRIGN